MSFLSSYWTPAIREAREREYRFLCQSRKVCRQAVENLIFYPDGPSPHLIAKQLYAEGLQQKLVTGTFDQFVGYCRDQYEFSVWGGANPYYSIRRGSRWGDPSNRHGQWFRKGPGYTRLPGHTKKTEENPKAAWREHKRFRHDKNKHKGYRGYNAGPWGKRQVHSKNRQHARRMIETERFDQISQNVKDVVRCWWD